MKKLCFPAMMALLILSLAGCGGEFVVFLGTPIGLEILSDPALDGDITMDLGTGNIGPPTVAATTGNVLAGIDINPGTGVPVAESRGFLIFSMEAIPSHAYIQFASIRVFLNDVSFVTSSTAPIPFLLDSIDTILNPPPIVSDDFNSSFRRSRSLSFFGRDAGNFVEINVTSLLADAQARGLSHFEVRAVFDQDRFLSDPTTTQGLITIDDRTTNSSRAPMLYVEYF